MIVNTRHQTSTHQHRSACSLLSLKTEGLDLCPLLHWGENSDGSTSPEVNAAASRTPAHGLPCNVALGGTSTAAGNLLAPRWPLLVGHAGPAGPAEGEDWKQSSWVTLGHFLPFDWEPHPGGSHTLRPGRQQALGLPTTHLDEEGVSDLKWKYFGNQILRPRDSVMMEGQILLMFDYRFLNLKKNRIFSIPNLLTLLILLTSLLQKQ